MARLIVAEEARLDIREILFYLRREAGAKVAQEYVNAFDRATDLLAEFPGMGTPHLELGEDARTVVVKPHKIGDDVIILLRVVHGRRNITIDLITRR
jgi:plasmid stabilization system protein ParE